MLSAVPTNWCIKAEIPEAALKTFVTELQTVYSEESLFRICYY